MSAILRINGVRAATRTKVVENNSIMVQQGKIYIVMSVVTIILIGLFIYVATIDKKIAALENNTKD
ncbi:MAG: CcmD family protein [Chitinophagia bacterium]|nr:CcmD family protein [Chitinophagia bacterium]